MICYWLSLVSFEDGVIILDLLLEIIKKMGMKDDYDWVSEWLIFEMWWGKLGIFIFEDFIDLEVGDEDE